nr:DUF305 domain-containing protein [Streptomyces sp. Ru73]
MKRSRRVAVGIVAAVGAAVLGAGGCSPDGGRADAAGDAGQQVIAPGKPGEPARTLSADEARKEAGDDSPNSADFAYVQMMITHHGQALVMTGLAEKHATSDAVKRIADRIDAAQRPEIDMMKGWLKSHGGPREEQGHEGHDGAGGHGGHAEHGEGGKHGEHSAPMPGMATEAQLDSLRAARGKSFDQLLLTLMITHHQGAVTMATDVLSEGNNVRVEEMATDVIAQQTAEIDRMRKLTP